MTPDRIGLILSIIVIALLLVTNSRPETSYAVLDPAAGAAGAAAAAAGAVLPNLNAVPNAAQQPVPAVAVAASPVGSDGVARTPPSLPGVPVAAKAAAAAGVPSGPTYPPPAADILQQMLPRQFPEAECRDQYSQHGIEKWRANRQPVCLTAGVDAGAIFHQTPWYKADSQDPPPSTVELRGLVKQADGSWTVPCAELNHAELQVVSRQGHQWYDSGVGYVLDKLRLRPHRPDSSDLACTAPIDTPALFMMREKGGGQNMYHELAQLFAAYLAKHVHGIPDTMEDPHNLRLIAFDNHQRDFNNKWDAFFWKGTFAQKRLAEAADGLPVGTCFRRAVLVSAGILSIVWRPFGHKPPCHRFPMMEGFARFVRQGTLGAAAAPTPTKRTLCYIPRGSAGRRLGGESEFLAKLRSANPHVSIVDGVLGEGALESFESQMRWVQQCTLLAGTHGSGLAYALFLPEEAVVVEHHTPGHGTFRGLAKAVGHTFIHVETSNENVGNYPAFARALRSAWHATNNFYHLHDDAEFVVPSNL
jgi:hypothetical protein